MNVTIQQAAINAFAAYLVGAMPDVTVEPRWPAPDKKAPAKGITIIPIGGRRDIPLDLSVLNKVNKGTYQTTVTWQVAACSQPVQMDIWAKTDVDRDDIMARLDVLLHAGTTSLAGDLYQQPAGYGTPVLVGDGWANTYADFVFESPDIDDTADNQGRSLYRATYTGNAHTMLTVTKDSARQAVINFQLRLAQDGDPTFTSFP